MSPPLSVHAACCRSSRAEPPTCRPSCWRQQRCAWSAARRGCRWRCSRRASRRRPEARRRQCAAARRFQRAGQRHAGAGTQEAADGRPKPLAALLVLQVVDLHTCPRLRDGIRQVHRGGGQQEMKGARHCATNVMTAALLCPTSPCLPRTLATSSPSSVPNVLIRHSPDSSVSHTK